MSFLTYDLILLTIFLILFSSFLYTRKKNIKKEGLLFLYRTRWGIKIIDYIGNKYKKTLGVLSYISVFVGYLLMVGVLYFVYLIVKIYILNPAVVRAVKVPPIIPLVPYLPQVFKLDFLPPFYFTYWIIILAVIAIPHEVAHGIFAARDKVKIKSTGFAFFPYFFPIFPAAFVEQDEKGMEKIKKFKQLSILSAGTFANIITAIIFIFILIGFFSLAFSPSGVIFDTYAMSKISIAGITMINGVQINNPTYGQILNLSSEQGFNNITANNRTYIATKDLLENQTNVITGIVVYDDAPAIRYNLSSIISEINGVKITSTEKLQEEILKYKPGNSVIITEIVGDNTKREVNITLQERPDLPGVAWIGIGFYQPQPNGFFARIIAGITSFKNQNVYYSSKINGVGIFIYNLLWWIIIISISVALVNMLPVGIFDGGRFFYLTVLGITKNEKIAKRAFAISTYLFLFIVLLLMIFWFLSFL